MRITVAPKEDLSGIGNDETFDIVYDFMVNGVCKDTEGKVLDNQSTGKKTVKYQDIDVKALAADNENFVDAFFYNIDANGAITEKK